MYLLKITAIGGDLVKFSNQKIFYLEFKSKSEVYAEMLNSCLQWGHNNLEFELFSTEKEHLKEELLYDITERAELVNNIKIYTESLYIRGGYKLEVSDEELINLHIDELIKLEKQLRKAHYEGNYYRD